jgi:APA family basic amino acid/polyamine antiporter
MTDHLGQSPSDRGGSPGLARSLRLPNAIALVVGTIIGATIFVQASEMTSLVPSVPVILLAWIFAGILAMFGALATAELASAFPQAGGVYVFLRESFGPLAGFLWGWSMFWIIHSGVISVLAVVFARYVGFFAPLDDRGVRMVAVGAIVAVSAVNCFGVKLGSTVQTLITVAKLAAIVMLVSVGFVLGSHLPAHFQNAGPASLLTPSHVTLPGFLLALIAGAFTFGGWQVATYAAEETVQPERTIPLALMSGIAVVTVCYVALNTVYFYILPLDRVAGSTRVAADAAVALVGSPGGVLISGLVAFSTFGSIIGSILGARVYFAMARDGLLFQWVSQVHPRFRTPNRAILLQAVWASLLVWTGTYRQLITRVVFVQWTFYALMVAGLFVLRRRPDYRPPYRVWAYPWVPAIYIVAALAMVTNRLRLEPLDSAFGVALVGLGVPAYYAWRRWGSTGTREAAALPAEVPALISQDRERS